MSISVLVLILAAMTVASFTLGRKRSLSLATITDKKKSSLHSLPGYYGALTAFWCAIPALLILALWLAFETSIITHVVSADLPVEIQNLPKSERNLVINDLHNEIAGQTFGEPNPKLKPAIEHYKQLQQISKMALAVIIIAIAILGGLYAWSKISPNLRARNHVEIVLKFLLISSSTIAILTTIGIVLSVLFEAIRFFQTVPLTEFLFGIKWSPQTAIRADQVGSSSAFGAVPLFTGTLLISFIAMIIAVPIGLMSAIYLSEYASRKFRSVVKPMLEILAGVPTVVYGFFAALTVAPFIRDNGSLIGLSVSSESALAAGLVMGIMLIPFISSLSDDVINAVPQAMRDGSYGLGATQSETVKRVILRAALPGIVGGILLAVSRAIGETMIVVMAAGLAANLTANPLESVTTVTVQIVTLLVGDQEFDSAKTLAAFALGLMLFVITLSLNVIALHIVRKYREQYE